jgi:hypothetical protein
VRRECLDRLLIFGRRQLEHVLRVYIGRQPAASTTSARPATAGSRRRTRSPAHSDPPYASHPAARPPRRTAPRIRSCGVKIEFVHPTGTWQPARPAGPTRSVYRRP